jgi:hypothetical protein
MLLLSVGLLRLVFASFFAPIITLVIVHWLSPKAAVEGGYGGEGLLLGTDAVEGDFERIAGNGWLYSRIINPVLHEDVDQIF